MSGLIDKYFPEISIEQSEQFARLEELYSYWNERINVISRKDIQFLYERHVLHSLAIAKVIKFNDSSKILDIGTGGGFPGIPLAILFPETYFNLIDSIGKKIKVIDAIVESLQLKNVNTQHIRAEFVSDKYDFVVSRAVAQLSEFIPWTKDKFFEQDQHSIPNGILLLKGGNLESELFSYLKQITIYEINNFFDEPFFSEKRVVYFRI